MQVLPKGVRHIPRYLNPAAQEGLLEDIRSVIGQSPLYTPHMPRTGKPMSVRMSNCGTLGWITDKERGYRYQPNHPVTGNPWPMMPQSLLDIWKEVSGYQLSPEACLINYYAEEAKMGLHQDRDEQDFKAPVVSVSLGDTCLFRVGENARGGRTTSFKLKSGDVVVLGGEGRLCFHGVDRIYPSTSALLKNGGRLNLTMRRVSALKRSPD